MSAFIERAEAAEANTVAVEHERDYLAAAIREAIAVRKTIGWVAGERILERALVRCAYCERYDCAWVTCDARLRAAVAREPGALAKPTNPPTELAAEAHAAAPEATKGRAEEEELREQLQQLRDLCRAASDHLALTIAEACLLQARLMCVAVDAARAFLDTLRGHGGDAAAADVVRAEVVLRDALAALGGEP